MNNSITIYRNNKIDRLATWKLAAKVAIRTQWHKLRLAAAIGSERIKDGAIKDAIAARVEEHDHLCLTRVFNWYVQRR